MIKDNGILLRILKETNHIEIAEYAIANKKEIW